MMSHTLHMTRRAALALIGVAALRPTPLRAAELEIVGGRAFGTQWSILAARGTGIARHAPAIEALFERYDRLFSPWRADSVVSRFNASENGRITAQEVIGVSGVALHIAELSRGAFNPTVGPLVARWGFGPIEGGSVADWRDISVSPKAVTKVQREVTLDLCGIAKGWALDRASDLIRSAGIEDALLDLGGELVALGHHPDGRYWQVAVDHALMGKDDPVTLALPPGSAVATSGTQVQSYALNGSIYSHIIDPYTNAPIAGGPRSVTVAAADATTADGWATALCAAGVADGPALAEAHGVSAFFQFEENGVGKTVHTGAFREMVL